MSSYATTLTETIGWKVSYGLVEVGDFLTHDVQTKLWTNEQSLKPVLLVNIAGNDWVCVLEAANFMPGFVGLYNWKQQPFGIWSDLKPTNETIEIDISTAVCFVSLTSTDLWIHATSEQNLTELRGMSCNRHF